MELGLVDFDMPDLNGFPVAALLRGIPPKKRIVMLSGHESKAPLNFRELDGFISKRLVSKHFLPPSPATCILEISEARPAREALNGRSALQRRTALQ